MSAFVCKKCGGKLTLSLPARAYLCETSPKDHCFDRGEAEQAWLKEASDQVQAAPGDVDAVFQLASLCGQLAATSIRVGDPDPARVYMSQVVGVIEPLYRENKEDERVRAMLMEALVEQATVAEKLNDQGMAVAAYERLLPFLRSKAEAEPKSIEHQRNLSTCLNSVGRMRRALGDGVGALKFFEQDLDVLAHVAELYPEKDELQVDLAVSHFNLFLVSVEREEELKNLRSAVEILGRMPSLPDKAKELEGRAKAELERIGKLESQVSSRLARATAEVSKGKGEAPVSTDAANQRDWLIGAVDKVLKERRRRLSVVN